MRIGFGPKKDGGTYDDGNGASDADHGGQLISDLPGGGTAGDGGDAGSDGGSSSDTSDSKLPSDAGVPPFVCPLAVSVSTACAVMSDGRVSCWGSDRHGALGDGPSDSSPGPVLVNGLQDAVAVGLSNGMYSSSACALRQNGTVSCWGSNGKGQLGDGTTTSRDTPVEVAGLTDARGLAVGNEFACALQAAGTIRCWGNGEAGSLGHGALASSPTPMLVNDISSAIQISSSNYAGHVCALLQDHSVWCWGANRAGQLGDLSHTAAATPRQLPGVASASDVAVGESFTCVLQGGEVWCLGENDYGQMGPISAREQPTLVQIPGISGARAIAAGASNACAILQDNSLYCWGAGAYNNLLEDRLVNRNQPVHLARLGSVAGVVIGGYTHGGPPTTLCAAKLDGTISCWGNNQQGQHGGGLRAATPLPVAASGYGSASAMGLGKGFSCALVSGQVLCAGSNVNGTLGDGSELARVAPSPVGGLQDPIGLSAGITWHLHTSSVCALLQGGNVACWGSRGAAQDGSPSGPAAIPQPVLLPGVQQALQVEVGESSACALLATGNVWCWGGNSFGQLGDGTTTGSKDPVRALLSSAATKIALTYRHVCALLDDETIHCWGEGDYGELGNPVNGNYSTPQVVPSISGAKDIDTGAEHSCAILTSTDVACWGADYAGQLGNGSAGTTHTPSPVGLSGVKALALGGYHSCALLDDGRIYCWGSNSHGELGDNTTIGRTAPVLVSGITDAQAVFAGSYFTCAQRTTGELSCFGSNQFGQLGTGQGFLSPSSVKLP